MSAFGFSLPGTTSYYNQRRGRNRSRRPSGQSGVRTQAVDQLVPEWEDPSYGKRFGTRQRSAIVHQGLPDRPNLYADPGSLVGGRGGQYGDTFSVDPIWQHARAEDLAQQEDITADEQAAQDALQQIIDRSTFDPDKAAVLEMLGGYAPEFAETTEMWRQRSADDAKAISDYAIQPALAEATRGGALYSQTARNQMAARGLGRSGLSASLQGAGAGIGARGRAQVRGGQAAVNAQMRQRAAEQLLGSQNLEAQLASVIGQVQMAQNPRELAEAALMWDIVSGKTRHDAYAWPSLVHGLEKEASTQQDYDDAFDLVEQQIEQEGRIDWTEIALGIFGSLLETKD